MESTNQTTDDAMESTKYGLQMTQQKMEDLRLTVHPRKSLCII